MKIKDIIFCWDFIMALIISIILFNILPNELRLEFTKDVYQTAISVLSIIFSLYFAALAIIITSNDNDFIKFLEEENIYSGIIDTFKFTLGLTFVALILSIFLYVLVSYNISMAIKYQSKYILISFTFFFVYSLFAVLNATIDSIIYSKKRTEYIKIKKS